MSKTGIRHSSNYDSIVKFDDIQKPNIIKVETFEYNNKKQKINELIAFVSSFIFFNSCLFDEYM